MDTEEKAKAKEALDTLVNRFDVTPDKIEEVIVSDQQTSQIFPGLSLDNAYRIGKYIQVKKTVKERIVAIILIFTSVVATYFTTGVIKVDVPEVNPTVESTQVELLLDDKVWFVKQPLGGDPLSTTANTESFV